MPDTPGLDPLSRLAIRFGSDKYGGHLYTPIYHQLFSGLREQPIKVLEIGIGGYSSVHAGGLSLRMWAEYFPYATIVGLDIEPKTLDLPPRVHVVQGSQVDHGLLVRLNAEHGPFDIIIDDGSHVVSHMIDSFRTLYPIMAPDGIYCIEDTQTCFMPVTGGRPDGAGTIFDVAHRVSLAMHMREGHVAQEPDGFIDSLAAMTRTVSVFRNVVVFHRGRNTYPSNHHLTLDNPEVSAVFRQIAEQDRRDPTPAGSISRVDMLIWAGRREEASALARQAAERFPKDLPLLFEMLRMMEWAEQEPTRAFVAGLLERAM